MPGFGDFAHNYDTRMNELPFYRKRPTCSQSPPLQRFAAEQRKLYQENAVKIRQARFDKSSAFNKDVALRQKRDSFLSTAASISDEKERRDYVAHALRQNIDKVDIHSLSSRTGLQLSRTGDALASGELKLTYDPRKGHSNKKIGTSLSNAAKAAGQAAFSAKQASTVTLNYSKSPNKFIQKVSSQIMAQNCAHTPSKGRAAKRSRSGGARSLFK